MNNHSIGYLLLVALVIIIIAFSFFLVFYGHQPFYSPFHRFLLNHGHRFLAAGDVNRIQSWMTFDYINTAFRLPSGYLKSALHIVDTHYPNTLISQYASEEKITPADGVLRVQEAVHDYLISPK